MCVRLVDCDDDNTEISPDAIEIPNNDVDEDCDGEDLISSTDNILEPQTTIDLTQLPKGLYILEIQSNDKNWYERILLF
ncbi:MAG: T9SS type A sorting domain-containing protein [Saprospiraceae bacterium]